MPLILNANHVLLFTSLLVLLSRDHRDVKSGQVLNARSWRQEERKPKAVEEHCLPPRLLGHAQPPILYDSGEPVHS